ncbi:hypothetical protein AB0I94_06615 [Streptomyces sp. NPDC050147]|uniref:hypothetical protein n=1 Tax=Streptomyces sp. NPDC050147 TaxID=3155513 RepID=UPI00343C267A
MSTPKYARPVAGVLCWDEKPGDVLHCTLGQDHGGDHFHAYAKARRPNRTRQKQSQR